MKSKMELKLVEIMAPIFEVEESEISENASPENLEKWDSLAHMNLVIALEQEFDIQFTEDQIVESLSFKALADILNNI
jgi:acyl carrier protein